MFNYLSLKPSDIDFVAIRAQGSGGQHVNKTSSAIHLQFNVHHSSLPPADKEKLLSHSDYRISKDGIITIKAQRFRSQMQNKQDAINRLCTLIQTATTSKILRKPTVPTKASNKKRLENKSRKATTKQLRQKPKTLIE